MNHCRYLIPMLALAAFHIGAHATTFTPDTTDDTVDATPGDGVCADTNSQCSLRAAVQESNAIAGEDTIVLGAGTYALTRAGGNEDAAASGDLDITDDLVLQGSGAEATIIDGGALDRVLDLPDGAPRTVHLVGLALRNGQLGSSAGVLGSLAGSGGAGVRVGLGTTLFLSHVDVRDNHIIAAFGAVGIDNTGCIHGDHVRIVDNTDPAGVGSGRAVSGGIVTDGEASCLELDDSEISGNRGDLSGALHVDGGASVTLRRTLVSGNTARFAGALELNIGGEVLLENVTLSGNAGNPGAVLVDGGTRLTVVNSTITGNHASAGTTVVGGIQDVHGGFGLTTLRNTILAGNGPAFGANDCSNATSLGGNLIGSTIGCMLASDPSDQLDVPASLSPLADNGGFTRTHLPGANAIDHGIADGCPSTDQRGDPRPIDGDADGTAQCDVGAVEAAGDDALFADGFEAVA